MKWKFYEIKENEVLEEVSKNEFIDDEINDLIYDIAILYDSDIILNDLLSKYTPVQIFNFTNSERRFIQEKADKILEFKAVNLFLERNQFYKIYCFNEENNNWVLLTNFSDEQIIR